MPGVSLYGSLCLPSASPVRVTVCMNIVMLWQRPK